MTQDSRTEITKGGKDRVNQCSELMAAAFLDDPIYNWFLYTTPDHKYQAHLLAMIHAVVKVTTIAHGYITEAGGWGSSAAFCPPGYSPDGVVTILQARLIPTVIKLGFSPCKRILVELSSAVERTKAKCLTREEKKKGFWYVAIMGTSPQRRRQGLAGKLIQDMQSRAEGDGCPIWLESTTPESKRLYSKHGFKAVEGINLGKGNVDVNGRAKAGGEGITIWGMLWRPRRPEQII
ncbi:hypothetical protein BKA67DRAFT_648684 [Truncatella angustata]|uniref:N-acetyltransferase domain-containing protein n=1 Tax=Truncatella angustata TaxID=152316 RepID=A0A9P8UF18_9PEZI|nr:uncharacterized protein BKA67DRAFT_648684 [Truncatella angustata]KAH6648685.1 hypothetical protein BKA67DRAFT_648684 [Truncatella angustata]